jgi:hypothetical protein
MIMKFLGMSDFFVADSTKIFGIARGIGCGTSYIEALILIEPYT